MNRSQDFRFPKCMRLRRRAQFDRVFRRRCSTADDWIIVYGNENDLRHPRLGMVVSRRNLRKAVDRNRFKRLVREVFRQHRKELPSMDLVVLPKRSKLPDYHVLARSLPRLAQRLRRKLKRREK